MTPLRQRMSEDMQLAGQSARNLALQESGVVATDSENASDLWLAAWLLPMPDPPRQPQAQANAARAAIMGSGRPNTRGSGRLVR
jgi:hypothetical protein